MSSTKDNAPHVDPREDPNVFLKSFDSSGMYDFVLKRGALGTAIGGSITGAFTWAGLRFSPKFRNLTTVSTRSFLVVGGAAVGFAIATDLAMVHYLRYLDRPEISGFPQIQANREAAEELRKSRMSGWQILKDWSWNNRFKLIAGAWATTMAVTIYRDFSNPLLSSVHKFGHARITAQAVTIAAIIAAFAFNEETGPWSDKYHPERAHQKRQLAEQQATAASNADKH